MRDKKVTGILRFLGKDSLKIMTYLVNNIQETGECPKYYIDFVLTALRKKPKARKYSNHRTASFITHEAKIVTRILGRCIEKIIEVILG